MKDSLLFGCYGAQGDLKEGMLGEGDDCVQGDLKEGMLGAGDLKEGMLVAGDDLLGELLEEDIVWGEMEVSQPHIKTHDGSGRQAGDSKTGTEIINGRKHRAKGRRQSLLSRQLEMQASSWAAGDGMFAARKSCSQEHQHVAGVGSEGGTTNGGAGTSRELSMGKLIPPHELLDRQYAASASFSVLHGAGRTLKGKDLCRLRNEVWRQTGFVD